MVLAIFYMLKIRKKPRELLFELENLLNVDPDRPWILRLLSEVAFGFGFVETAIFSIQCIPEEARNVDDWLLVGEAYLGLGNFTSAIEIANRVLRTSPDNLRARDLLWQASVEQSIDGDTKHDDQ
jgi:predicted Zn-dependent protease